MNYEKLVSKMRHFECNLYALTEKTRKRLIVQNACTYEKFGPDDEKLDSCYFFGIKFELFESLNTLNVTNSNFHSIIQEIVNFLVSN